MHLDKTRQRLEVNQIPFVPLQSSTTASSTRLKQLPCLPVHERDYACLRGTVLIHRMIKLIEIFRTIIVILTHATVSICHSNFLLLTFSPANSSQEPTISTLAIGACSQNVPIKSITVVPESMSPARGRPNESNALKHTHIGHRQKEGHAHEPFLRMTKKTMHRIYLARRHVRVRCTSERVVKWLIEGIKMSLAGVKHVIE